MAFRDERGFITKSIIKIKPVDVELIGFYHLFLILILLSKYTNTTCICKMSACDYDHTGCLNL